MIERALRLPESAIEKNREYIGRLRGYNRILADARGRKTPFVDEVENVFYYFPSSSRTPMQNVCRYVKNVIRTPRLQRGHETHLEELEEVLNGIDLRENDEIARISWRQIRDEEGETVRTYAQVTGRSIEDGLEGRMPTADLHEDRLQEFLARQTRRRRLINMAATPLAALAPYLAISALQEWSNREYFSVAVDAALSLWALYNQKRFLLVQATTYPPPAYWALREKASRTDWFLSYQEM